MSIGSFKARGCLRLYFHTNLVGTFTTKLYDRRDKAVTRDIVERISVKGLEDQDFTLARVSLCRASTQDL